MEKQTLTVWEAACIITGYGIGGGVLAMPYLTAKNGIIAAGLILLAAMFFKAPHKKYSIIYTASYIN